MSHETQEGWVPSRLGAAAENVKEKWEPGEPAQPYVGLEHIDQGTGRLLEIGELEDLQSIKTRFRGGDVLFGKLRPNLRKTALINFPGVASTDILVIRPVRMTSEFAFYRLSSDEAFDHAIKSAAGTKMPRTSWKDMADFEFPLPPLHEQRRISEILSSVDGVIAATRAVIEQTRKVKQSSLESLFHRGNWTEAERPAGHHLARLEDVARRGSGHTPSKKFREYWNGGIAWVSLQDTKALDRRHIDKTVANISDLGVKNSSAEIHPAGTVFVSRDATVGKVGIMQTPMAVSQHFIAWICGPMLNNLFLYYWLLNMKPIFERIAAGSTIKTIGLGFFKELQIALPNMAAQKRIASQMMAIDDALDRNEASLDELKALKSALMSDLLTGRKRVADALPMAAE